MVVVGHVLAADRRVGQAAGDDPVPCEGLGYVFAELGDAGFVIDRQQSVGLAGSAVGGGIVQVAQKPDVWQPMVAYVGGYRVRLAQASHTC
jgi:hypothetical protein